MDRETFLARKRVTKTFNLEDGSPITICKLSQAQVETMRRQYGTPDKTLEGFRYVVAQCVVGDDGKRWFTDQDQTSALKEMAFEDAQAIASEVVEFSGVGAKNAVTLKIADELKALESALETLAAANEDQTELRAAYNWLLKRQNELSPKKS